MNIRITPELKRVAFIGNYLPRKCGIATFTSDLAEAFSEQFPEIQTMTLAMNDTDEGYSYPSQVRYEITQDDRFDYEHAAHFLNQQAVDIISLQHEYGIYGGLAGSHILTLLRNVTAPVVTTLHTILETPLPVHNCFLAGEPSGAKEYRSTDRQYEFPSSHQSRKWPVPLSYPRTVSHEHFLIRSS